MKHKNQRTNFSCVYATLSMILGGDEEFYYRAIAKKQIKQLKCGKRKYGSGTYAENTSEFLTKYSYEHTLIKLNDKINSIFWLKQLSYRFPIYVDGIFIRKGERGRPRKDCHAFAVFEGKIFDPAEDFELEFESCSHYSEMIVQNVIPVFRENENYGKGININ